MLKADTSGPPDTFTVPKNGEIFISNIEERCQDLISSNLWNGLDATNLRIWLNNFKNDRERYLAACILDSLIYRSPEQTTALMSQIFHRSLPDLHRHINIPNFGPGNFLPHLKKSGATDDIGVRIVPVIRVNDPPTKSGPLLARMYKHRLGVNEKWMIWPWQIPDAKQTGVQVFLFIDDFLGTGTQFHRFAKHFGMQEMLKDVTAIYCPLAGHEVGINKLKEDCKWLHVCCAEKLTHENSLFLNPAGQFCDGVNSTVAAKRFYRRMLVKRSMKIESDYVDGYGKLSLTYVFEHATPNNCLPLLWYAHANWNPLFRR